MSAGSDNAPLFRRVRRCALATAGFCTRCLRLHIATGLTAGKPYDVVMPSSLVGLALGVSRQPFRSETSMVFLELWIGVAVRYRLPRPDRVLRLSVRLVRCRRSPGVVSMATTSCQNSFSVRHLTTGSRSSLSRPTVSPQPPPPDRLRPSPKFVKGDRFTPVARHII